jgi:hypothetical protein
MQADRLARAGSFPIDRCLPPLTLLLLGACATGNRQTVSTPASARTTGYEVHEATGEDTGGGAMDLNAEHGFLSQDDAEDAIKAQWSRLVDCYQQAGPARDFAAGMVRLRFLVDGQGRASDVYILESQLGVLEVERCLTATARTIVFPRPQGGKVTTVDYSLEFRSTGEITVVDLPASDLARPFASWLPELAAECHELAFEEVLATFYVEPRGRIRSVGFASARTLSEETTDCLSRVIQRWSLRADRSRALRRGQVVVRRQELLERWAAQNAPAARPVTQGRRGGSRR